MIVWMSSEQLRITLRANDFLREIVPKSTMQPAFNLSGDGLSVGLTFAESGQVFIVRETVPANSTLGHIYDVCVRVVATMSNSYATYMAMERLQGGK